MQGDGGWNDKCADLLKTEPETYSTIEQCLFKNNGKIQDDVKAMQASIERVNKPIGKIEDREGVSESGIFSKRVNTAESEKAYISEVFNKTEFTGSLKDTSYNLIRNNATADDGSYLLKIKVYGGNLHG